jgi:hypothetical protein
MGRVLTPAVAGSSVKSIQEVAKTVTFNTTSNSTISSVDTSKTIMTSTGAGMLGTTMSANANVRGRTEANAYGIGTQLTSATNVQFSTNDRPDSGGNTLYSNADAQIVVFVLEFV